MRSWPADHPKAKLLGRKRADILAAARRQFLAHGYGGTSMEAIAADAGVSIMTLYRHAERKDELFEAVISIACDPEEEAAGAEAFVAKPLRELLVITALMLQTKLLSRETIALLRAVISEQERFPDLAAVAYRAAIGHLEEFVTGLLGTARETRAMDVEARRALAARFSDALFGTDVLRILLGLAGRDAADQQARAARAADELIAAVGERRAGNAAAAPIASA